jgi:uncharacterized protein (DUF362 family)/Pyruvate/2-oxoacid:ferredoxin oxidoreductase delta subunit
MSIVFIRRTEYDYKSLKPVFFEIMDRAADNMIKKNSRVVIKPNLLAPAAPDRAVVTHPMIVKAAVEYVLDKGAHPVISDSPAVGSFEKILKESGIRAALEGLKVEYAEFRTSLSVDVGKPFNEIEIAADAVNADFFINLPKMKTHAQMLMTLGIKNLFGCIVGMKKPEWHLRTGIDREMFARLLVKIFNAVNPDITVMDSVLAMQGEGPGKSGEPRHIGLILGSRDTAAIDFTICKMLGIAPDRVLTNKYIMDQGMAPDEIIIDGEMPEVRDFRFPDMAPLVFGPRQAHNFMRKHLVQRPVCDEPLCKLCGECWKYCPAKAITHDKKRIEFNYEKCIRCYCCVEVCPHGALSAHETVLGKAARKLLKI